MAAGAVQLPQSVTMSHNKSFKRVARLRTALDSWSLAALGSLCCQKSTGFAGDF
jgi:hypothetical protein